MSEFKGIEAYLGKFPVYLEYRLDRIAEELSGLEDSKKKEIIAEEEKKLDLFFDILSSTHKETRETELSVYGPESEEYYIEFCNAEERRGLEIEAAEREKQRKIEAEEFLKKRKLELGRIAKMDGDFYAENGLCQEAKDKLFSLGLKRIKISPFGTSGAAFYWVRPRYNESKEHAFFCYLIADELKKRNAEPELLINNGPDVVFKLNGNTYCFDVETGKSYERDRGKLEDKFAKYRQVYDRCFILITNKKFKRKYAELGEVVSRYDLIKTLDLLFQSQSIM